MQILYLVMALSRLLFMAARIVASNPNFVRRFKKLLKLRILSQTVYYKANKNIKEAADEAAKKSPPNENIYRFMGTFVGSIKKKIYPKQ